MNHKIKTWIFLHFIYFILISVGFSNTNYSNLVQTYLSTKNIQVSQNTLKMNLVRIKKTSADSVLAECKDVKYGNLYEIAFSLNNQKIIKYQITRQNGHSFNV